MPKKRIRVGQWWELEAANGDRVEEYSACPPPVGTGVPQRFDEEDLKPTCGHDGQKYEDGLSEVERVKEQYEEHGPFKLIKVTRYKLVKQEPAKAIDHHPKCHLLTYGAGPGVCDCQRESFKKKWAGAPFNKKEKTS